MELAAVDHDYALPILIYEHDWIHILYMSISLLFFLIEVYQRMSVDLLYAQNVSGSYVPSLNRYPTDLTPTPFSMTSVWYLVFLWQSAWMAYSMAGIFRRTPSGTYFYRHPCVMNKWCFFYTAFGLILYTPQLAAAARNKYGVRISIFRHVGTLCELIVILVVVHVSLWENIKEYLRHKFFVDVWLTRLLYHNGLALWTSVLYYESCLAIVIGLIYSDLALPSNACIIGCCFLLFGLVTLSIVENMIFYNAMAFTLSPWLIFVWLLGDALLRCSNEEPNSSVVVWLIRFTFSLTCALAAIRLVLFVWRYKHKIIPTFQSPRIYSLVVEPRPF